MTKTSSIARILVSMTLSSGAASFAFAQTPPKLDQGAPATNSARSMKSTASTVKADNPLQLANDAPTIYVVVKGDTLWDISGKFLKEPWRWPEIWNMNRDQIKNPHLIYPGDVVKLSFDGSGKPLLSLLGRGDGSIGLSRLSPRIRSEAISDAIPSIPASVISPFLSSPLVVSEGALNAAPRIIASEESRVIVGAGNVIYGLGLKPEQGSSWQIYRPGKVLRDPVTKEILGYEAVYLGDAKVTKFGEGNTVPTTLEVTKSTQEINRGDRLTPQGEAILPLYSPRPPSKEMNGAVVSVLGGVAEGAQYSIIVTNLGSRDGIEIGNVIAAQRGGEVVTTNTGEDEARYSFSSLLPASLRRNKDGIPPEVTLPMERNGLAVVFRVFDRVSYSLIMSSKSSVKVGDKVTSP